MRIVIVGGVAGGASAAARARRKNAQAEIVMLEKGPVMSFANCGLPYHIGGEIVDRNKLLVATKELFWKRFRIDVRINHEVTAIDRTNKCVHFRDLAAQTIGTLPYDKLILSTGSVPVSLPELPTSLSNVFHLWTLSDMDRILDYIKTRSVKTAVVVGGGFVGLEVVEQLHRTGIGVTLLERNPQVLKPLDRLFAHMVEQHMESKGIRLEMPVRISNVELKDGRATKLCLSNGTIVDIDLVIVGAGVKPRVALAEKAGLTMGALGGIVVNESMQTSDPDIYAVGDIAESIHGVTAMPTRIPLAGPANRGGRIAGEHAASGSSDPMGKILGTAIVRVFDLTVACTGLNESSLTAQRIDYRTAIVQAGSHASYFPGAESMQLKILYSPIEGRLLGAQAVGGEGVDKRIDVIATAMHFGGTVRQLAQLDLAYAPPYGSAKDPVHMAAFAACNDLDITPRLVTPDADLDGKQIVDVRTSTERNALTLLGAIAIEVDDMADRWQELDSSKPTVVVCHSGKRAHVAASYLKNQGFADVANLTGGMALRSLNDGKAEGRHS